MKGIHRAALLAAVLLVSGILATPARAQQNRIIPAAIGGVLGVGSGGYVALGVIALKARHGEYLFGIEDVLGWESAAVLAGGGYGLALGAVDPDRLRNTVFSVAAGGLIGTGIGVLVGRRKWPPPEGKWAGGVIGGAAGILVGAGVGLLLPTDLLKRNKNDALDGGVPLMLRIPVGG